MMWNKSGSLSVTVIFTKDLSFRLHFCGQRFSWSFVKIHGFLSPFTWYSSIFELWAISLFYVSWTDCSDERLGSSRLEIDEHSRSIRLPSPTLPIVCYTDGSQLKLAMVMHLYIMFFYFLSWEGEGGRVGVNWPFSFFQPSIHIKDKITLISNVNMNKNLQYDLNLGASV